jgi:transcription antitermination factor NusG
MVSAPALISNLSEQVLYEEVRRNWFAVFTMPQHEKSVARQLHLRGVESFLPTYDSLRSWKNRQQVTLALPLFPSYLFVRIAKPERFRVLQAPGVLRIVGNHCEPIPVPDETIEFLGSDLCLSGLEPFGELVVGQSVRIKSGAFRGLRGTLVRRNNNAMFVLNIELIHRHVAVQVHADSLEPISPEIQQSAGNGQKFS